VSDTGFNVKAWIMQAVRGHKRHQYREKDRGSRMRAGDDCGHGCLRRLGTIATVMALLVITPTSDLVGPAKRLDADWAQPTPATAVHARAGYRTYRQRDIYLGSGVRAAVADMAVRY